MELFKNTNYDFLGKKWPFIIASLILTAAGLVSLAIKGGPKYGIDFRGGALMTVSFAQDPPEDKIRAALSAKIPGEISVQRVTGKRQVIIGTEIGKSEQDEKALNSNRQVMEDALQAAFGAPEAGKLDLNRAPLSQVENRLRDGLQKASISINDQQLQDLAKAIVNYRDTPPRSGIIGNLDELKGVNGVTPQVLGVLKQECTLGQFNIVGTDVVGPKIGADLQRQAILATLYALGGMLVYIAFRFEWIYGVAAVIAVFHDTIITVGLFSLTNTDLSLTVVAALLTLVGYSMNDTIVVFDRIRENLKMSKRETLEDVINRSVNQTLSRTILTSGLTLLTAASLLFFGGQVLYGFSFALVCGIIVGTYSSVFIASPILIFWQDLVERRKKPGSAGGSVKESSPKKVVSGRA